MSHPIQPLLHDAGDRVLVYGQPICRSAGTPSRRSAPIAGGTRRGTYAVPPFEVALAFDQRPARVPHLRGLRGTLPWAVRSSTRSVLATSLATSRGQWREGMSRLERYRPSSPRSRAGGASPREANPYRDLFEILAAPPAESEDPEEAAAITQQPTYWGLPTAFIRCSACASAARSWCSSARGQYPPAGARRARTPCAASRLRCGDGVLGRCSRQRAWTRSPTTCIHRVAERRTRSIGGGASRGPR
jgi:hypothetical protein